VIARDVLDIEVELIEIDENLCRADLTAAQRAQGVSRRQDLWEALQAMGGGAYGPQAVEPLPELGQGEPAEPTAKPPTKPKKELGGANCATHLDSIGRKKSPQQSKAFAAETAALTGETKSTINRQLARAAALGDDIKAVVGTSLDKGGGTRCLERVAGSGAEGADSASEGRGKYFPMQMLLSEYHEKMLHVN
jgi:hypothetical protein